MKFALFAALVASASAFAPASVMRTSTALNLEYGQFDGGMWNNDNKKVVYEKFDPASPRSVNNFNPFETFEGNSPDASGYYPGEKGYKDPQRGDVSYATMLVERAEIEERLANPKAGFTPGCAGCKN
uniref:PS II complex 12 kDa extrinsic protein n=1 Tax=Pseudo-nitzschia delicatissima TaxID=44447 RepID=A0A7S0UJL9_9STRA|mmetsp:Transcript_2968/g.6163  ORF Transcript_2968/g.6163 Transcript_2968/m.6163 type:complete len:127 (+) Transcript_2968:66-446(+)